MKRRFEDDLPAPPACFLTQSQALAYGLIRDLGELFYGRAGEPGPSQRGLCPRLFPLLCAPTGAGKTYLVAKAADELGAAYFRVTYGDWIPLGTREPHNATMVRLGQVLGTQDRVLVHIDELDKWLVSGGEWGRSISTDLWNLLDRRIPWDQLLVLEGNAARDDIPAKERSAPDWFKNFGRIDHLWLVGSGTWQSVFEARQAPKIGFGASAAAPSVPSASERAEAIRRSKAIPTELMARFAADLVFIDYPTPAETIELLERFGLHELAQAVGQKISPVDVDFAANGMRAFESLKTRLLLAHLRQTRNAAPESFR